MSSDEYDEEKTGVLIKNRIAAYVSKTTSFEELLKSKKCTYFFTIDVQHFEKVVKLFTQEHQQKYDEEKQKYYMLYVRLDCTGDKIIGMVCRQEMINNAKTSGSYTYESNPLKSYGIYIAIQAQNNEQKRRVTEHVTNSIKNTVDIFAQRRWASIIKDIEYTKRL